MNQVKTAVTENVRAQFVRQIRSSDYLTSAIARATRAAVLEHKRIGNPIAAWQDGEVVIIQPEDIVFDDDIDSVNI